MAHLLVLALWLPVWVCAVDIEDPTPITRIGFGSCSKHDKPQPLWDPLIRYRPELFVWLGDIVYADTRVVPLVWKRAPVDEMEAKWQAQRQHPGYQKFLDTGVRVVGTWDDHDYGKNDGGWDYVNKTYAKQYLLDFLEEGPTHIRRQRDGVYVSYGYGVGTQRVLLVLLDDRWFSKRVAPDGDDILGPQQWAWLGEQLRDPAPLKLIGSGIQVIANTPIVESWRRFPKSFARLLQLIKDKKAEGVVFLSGDVHFAEASCCHGQECRPAGYALNEMTSSGMTHNCPLPMPGFLCNMVLTWLSRGTYRIGHLYGDLNFGTLDIDWSAGILKFTAVGTHGPTQVTHSVKFTDLRSAANQMDEFNGCPVDLMPYRIEWRFIAVISLVAALMILIGFSALHVVATCLCRVVVDGGTHHKGKSEKKSD